MGWGSRLGAVLWVRGNAEGLGAAQRGWGRCRGYRDDAVRTEAMKWGWRRRNGAGARSRGALSSGAGPHPRAPLEPPTAPGVQGCVGARGSARQPRGSHGNGGWERLGDGGWRGKGGPRGDPRRETHSPLCPIASPHRSALRRRPRRPVLVPPPHRSHPRNSAPFPPSLSLRPHSADPTVPSPHTSTPPPPPHCPIPIPPSHCPRPIPTAPRRHRPHPAPPGAVEPSPPLSAAQTRL